MQGAAGGVLSSGRIRYRPMKYFLFIPRALLFVMFVPMMVFIALVPFTWVRFLAFRRDRIEYVQLWRNMWRWTIGEAIHEDDRPGTALLLGLGALAATTIVVTVRIWF
jgi:hypothetical protein